MLPSYSQALASAMVGPIDKIRLGTALPDVKALDAIVAWYCEQIDDPYLPREERLAAFPLPFAAFCYALESRGKIARDERRREALSWQIQDSGKGAGTLHVLGQEDPAVRYFLRHDDAQDYTPDLAGWLAYLKRKMPFENVMARHRPYADFPEISRRMHTLVVAATGHGKSEVLKALLHHYAVHRSAGVIVLDPGRNLAQDMARWPELHRDNRVIYVEPELRPGLTVGFNPFSGGHLLEERERSHLAETIGLALSEMTMDLTENMETLVTNCAMVLLDFADATMQDLGRMVSKPPDEKKSPFAGAFMDERRDKLLSAAYYHRDPDVRDFFRYRFDATAYNASREFLGTRIDRVTTMVDVRNALFGVATLDLERELNAGKFVLVNLAKYGRRKQRAAIGRLLVAMVAGIASRRAQVAPPYTPIHLVVDEVTTMASPTMIETLNENRKFGLHGTFAQQVDGDGFTREQAHSLVTNTRCRLAATDDPKEGAALLDPRTDPDTLPLLQTGQFWVRWEGMPGVHTVQVRSDLVVRNRQGEVDPDADPAVWLPEPHWQAYVEWLTTRGGYYRQARTRPLHTDTAPPVAPVGAPEAAPSSADMPTAPPRPAAPRGRAKTVPAYEVVPGKARVSKPRKRADSAASPSGLIGADNELPG